MKEFSSRVLIIRRVCAFLIDLVLWLALQIPVQHYLREGYLTGVSLQLTCILLIFIIPAIYTIALWKSLGATLGMMICKLKVVSIESHDRPSFIKIIVRYAVFFLSWFSLLIGFLWALFDSRKQTFADKLSNTIVIPSKDDGRFIHEPTNTDVSRWKVGKVIVVLSILILIVVNFVWQYEEPLTKEATEALRDFSPDTNPQENGFYALIAFGVQENMSPFEEGFKRTTEMNEQIISALEEKTSSSILNMMSSIKTVHDSLDEELNILSSVDSEEFLNFTKENSDFIKQYYQKYSYMEERYHKLSEYKSFNSKIIPDIISPAPIMLPLIVYERLYVFNFVDEYMRGNIDNAINLMKKEEAVCMNLLEKSDTLINKLVACIMMYIHQNGVNQLLNYENDIDYRLYDYVQNMTDYSREALSIREAYMHEYNCTVAFISRMLNSPEAITDYSISPEEISQANPLFFKANNIINHTYLYHDSNADYSELPTYKMMKLYGISDVPKYSFFETMYNPLGVIFSKNYLAAYHSYPVKIRDLQVRLYMLKAIAHIKKLNLNNEDIVTFLNSKKDSMYNHYNNEPFNWDSSTHTISFIGPNQEANADSRMLKIK